MATDEAARESRHSLPELEARGAGEVLTTDLEHWDSESWPLRTRERFAEGFAGRRLEVAR
ncbi:MAG: hypothetical protein ACR2OB_06435 [Solirubrobacteraceae bacterium]